jgi:Na+-driven multidrug efflux pump
VYGLGLWVVMNYVVLPLSAARPGSKDALWVALSILVHMFLIGVPIAWFTQRAIDRSR